MSSQRRRFRILEKIAEGGFGKVYLAEQLGADGFSRIVALKLLHTMWSGNDEVVRRSRDEARLLGLLRHAHIVRVEDLTSLGGRVALVMEYLEGVDLKWMVSFLRDEKLVFPRRSLFEIAAAICSALDAAYNATPLQGDAPLRVIHRDIKPSNVFVTTAGNVKLLDFGTSRAEFGNREAETAALAFGSQDYMAPERLCGEPDTPAADVFSLGISLYELLTLESFGRIKTRPEAMVEKVRARVAELHVVDDPEMASEARSLLVAMLAYAPEDRPSAGSLVRSFDMLADRCRDHGLRRFARTLVSEAKGAMPPFASGDPLTGEVVEEDASTTFHLPQRAVDELVDHEGDLPTDTGSVALSEVSSPFGGPSEPIFADGPIVTGTIPRIAPPALLDLGVLELTGEPEDDSFFGTAPGFRSRRDPDSPDEPTAPEITLQTPRSARAGGLGWALAAAALFLAGSGFTAAAVAMRLAPSDAPAVVMPAMGLDGDEVAAPAGVERLSAGGWAPESAIPTTLAAVPGGPHAIEVAGQGFRLRWDGVVDLDTGGLAPGVYATTVTPAGGRQLRGRRFVVAPGAPACRFVFDLDSGAWRGGCETSP